jgi:hypothetical protein
MTGNIKKQGVSAITRGHRHLLGKRTEQDQRVSPQTNDKNAGSKADPIVSPSIRAYKVKSSKTQKVKRAADIRMITDFKTDGEGPGTNGTYLSSKHIKL